MVYSLEGAFQKIKISCCVGVGKFTMSTTKKINGVFWFSVFDAPAVRMSSSASRYRYTYAVLWLLSAF